MSYTHNELRKVGFWAGGPGNEEYPRVETMVDSAWNRTEQNAVLDHLRRGAEHASYRGWSDCRVCGKSNGSRDYTDGTYVWPEGFAHYITVHNVKPPRDFIEHVLRSR